MSDELDRLRRENERLLRDRREKDDLWCEEDKEWKIGTKTSIEGLVHSQLLLVERMEVHAKNMSEVRMTVYGNPATKTKGLANEVESIKETQESHQWWTRTALGAAMASAAAWAWAAVTGVKP